MLSNEHFWLHSRSGGSKNPRPAHGPRERTHLPFNKGHLKREIDDAHPKVRETKKNCVERNRERVPAPTSRHALSAATPSAPPCCVRCAMSPAAGAACRCTWASGPCRATLLAMPLAVAAVHPAARALVPLSALRYATELLVMPLAAAAGRPARPAWPAGRTVEGVEAVTCGRGGVGRGCG